MRANGGTRVSDEVIAWQFVAEHVRGEVQLHANNSSGVVGDIAGAVTGTILLGEVIPTGAVDDLPRERGECRTIGGAYLFPGLSCVGRVSFGGCEIPAEDHIAVVIFFIGGRRAVLLQVVVRHVLEVLVVFLSFMAGILTLGGGGELLVAIGIQYKVAVGIFLVDLLVASQVADGLAGTGCAIELELKDHRLAIGAEGEAVFSLDFSVKGADEGGVGIR